MLKQQLKALYYTLQKTQMAPFRLRLGYVFHTEAVYDPWIFDLLKTFCVDYFKLTGKKPICTVIPGNSPLIYRASSDPDEYVRNVGELAKFADIGYHGHYFLDPQAPLHPENRVLHANFVKETVDKQFLDEVTWFTDNHLPRPEIYSAGWWMYHPHLVRLLLKHRFTLDCSISPSPWLYSQFSRRVLRDNHIFPGQSFRLGAKEHESLLCVQNLIGCHDTPFPEDFIRNLKVHLNPQHTDVVGVVHSHDYNLIDHLHDTLHCLSHLAEHEGVTFLDAADLLQLPAEHHVSIDRTLHHAA